MSTLRIDTYTGAGLRAHLADIARLRIDVFRAWPYLYDGNVEFEQRYLQTYVDTADAMVALCFDGDQVIGASTALPLIAETHEIKAPFLRGLEASPTVASLNSKEADSGKGFQALKIEPPSLQNTLYLGESVLDPAWRGRGIGIEFFAQREAHARRLGLRHCVFCAVQRAVDDPRRPSDYVPLERFWRKRGYRALAGVTTTMRWREIGEDHESPKPMQFFHKQLEITR